MPKFNKTDEFEKLTIAAGTILFRQGDLSDKAYLIQKGRIRIFRQVDNKEEIEIAIIEAGEVVGEMALIKEARHTNNAEVIEDANMIVIGRNDISQKFLTTHPIMKKIIFCLVNRLYKANEDAFKNQQS